jgi:hypothetical protein
MRIGKGVSSTAIVALLCAPAFSATIPDTAAVPTKFVITTLSTAPNARPLEIGNVRVATGSTPLEVLRMQPLPADLSDAQIYILLDDSTRSASLGLQIPELKTFMNSLPATSQVAVGYMRNGSAMLSQAFTTDHAKAAAAVRLPQSVPGENGSPYFALSDLVRHWPSKDKTDRRVVLMMTDGVDRYWASNMMDDPYVHTATEDAIKNGVMVYSIYVRGAGRYGTGLWSINMAQSRMAEVSEQTGGAAYFEGITDPVTIQPFLSDFRARLDHQYELTIAAPRAKVVQPVKVWTEAPGLKVEGPSYIYTR